MNINLMLLTNLLLFSFVNSQFDLQYIGNYVSEVQESQREYCDSKYCLLDANQLFYTATQNTSVNPCDDFKEFSLGTFIKLRAISDRTNYNGFLSDLQFAHDEKHRKLLSEKVDEIKDTKVTKIMKFYFANCVNSKFIKANGTKVARDYLKSLGISFHPESDQSGFRMTKLLKSETKDTIFLFLKHELYRCQPNNKSKEVLCLKFHQSWKSPEAIFDGYREMLYEMNGVSNNMSYADELSSEFKAISHRLLQFYNLQVFFNSQF